MSSINTERVKSISKKEISGFSTPIPIGTDGLLVDMLSGLDLEEENKLGNNHSATITEIDDNTTQIIEQYYDNSSPKVLKYSVFIKIEENGTETIITMKLFKGAINRDNQDNIIENNLLHTKITIIDESSSSITQIDQEVDGE